MTNDQQAKEALNAIDKEYGEGTIIRLGDKKTVPIAAIPTGLYEVDYDVAGIGGFPRGRMVEIYGPESSGKTTIALLVVASAQRMGGLAAYIDAEHALDPAWMTKNGVDVDNLFLSQPDYGEQALSIAETLVESGGFDVIVIDSVAALVPKAELEGDMGDSHMGLQARMMSQAMRKLTGKVAKSGTCLIFINQVRDKIGVMFGSPETTTGGRALKFYASMRLDVRRIGSLKNGETIIGNTVKVKAAKNKCAAPFRETEVTLLFGQGFDVDGSVFDAALKAGIVQKSGSWFSKGDTKLGQGRLAAIESMRTFGLIEEFVGKLKEGREAKAAA